jgi:hypothetical protein
MVTVEIGDALNHVVIGIVLGHRLDVCSHQFGIACFEPTNLWWLDSIVIGVMVEKG